MKIWILSAYDPLPQIDTDIRLLRYGSIAEALVEQGHQVVFWTSTFAHWRKQSRFNRDSTHQLAPNFRVEFLHAPGYSHNVSLTRIRHNRHLARAFTRHAETSTELPDVILAEIPCLELAEAGAVHARRHGIRFICDIQDIWPDVYLTWLPRWLHTPGRWFLHREYARLRKILAHCHSVTAVSQAYLNWVKPWLPRKLDKVDAVFPLGYALPSFDSQQRVKKRLPLFLAQHQIAPDHLVVTFLGQFATSYDVTTIVKAARILEKQTELPQFRIVLAGEGDKASELRHRSVGLQSIVFTGWLEYIDTICLLSSSHVALAAYTQVAAQSLPYKPFEYMAFSLPIINSLPGEMSDLITKNNLGANYVAGSAESLAEAISDLLLDSKKRVACASHANQLFEEDYSAATIYRNMAHFICNHHTAL